MEDESATNQKDARTLLAKFNEQIQPLYDLLRECEDVKLAPELMEPEPTDIRSSQKYDVFISLTYIMIISISSFLSGFLFLKIRVKVLSCVLLTFIPCKQSLKRVYCGHRQLVG